VAKNLRRFALITFDVYTALFDAEGSLAPRLEAALGVGADGRAVARAWRRRQMEYALISNSLGQARVPFALITRRALDDTLRRLGRELGQDARAGLVAAWDELSLWLEAGAVLAEVRARGHDIGLLSNGDRAMLQALAARLPVAVDHIFASEQAGYYKPHPSVYRLPLEWVGLAPVDVLHVAGSVTDVMGTRSAGLACAWSNRHYEHVLDPALAPDYEFRDLRGLLKLL
jgi:2-haloacid dehalogenase